LALDLGCGPGNTTALVAQVTGARRTIGLDRSAAFVAEARTRVTAPGVEFRQHDVTATPFPAGPADFLYARLLVAHLADPATAVARWLTQLAPGGRLAVEEVEWIDTADPILAEYLEIVVALLAANGGDMFAGPTLAALRPDAGTARRHDEVVVLPVDAAQAARMFRLNLGVWGADPWVADRYGAATVTRLAGQLERLSATSAPAGITWGLRHLVFERAER
jgi:SAM-dependent methyltransferase